LLALLILSRFKESIMIELTEEQSQAIKQAATATPTALAVRSPASVVAPAKPAPGTASEVVVVAFGRDAALRACVYWPCEPPCSEEEDVLNPLHSNKAARFCLGQLIIEGHRKKGRSRA
jgi:hypothetical protein